jgi:hypothetical protein
VEHKPAVEESDEEYSEDDYTVFQDDELPSDDYE